MTETGRWRRYNGVVELFSSLRTRLRSAPPKNWEARGLQLKEAAVLAPLFWRTGEPWVYLTQRPMHLRKHPGQISFPGGVREPSDATVLHTALRETKEELGLDPEHIDILGMLGSLPTVTSYWVTPFVGVVPADAPLSPSKAEIEKVIEAPLLRMREERRHIWGAERPVYVWDDARHVVWGATWRMLRQLLEHIEAVRCAELSTPTTAAGAQADG